ncbi:MAG: hypothetical protein ABI837_19865 [Acidobacteriota bacterium]
MIIAVKQLCTQTLTDVKSGRETWRVLGACSTLAVIASVARVFLNV